ncbi:hypothetical protein [Actinoallomurus rhizosphaericola]|uniref:hypothetical protein n=1 Tax=Actinoallomurus rhizosphaericola TaxID=2952536 RepID=UPI002093EB43|nr:hypothetical protein [Actinoallomurus rhizosphaericola]MCO5996236.1 hypothetical protein [Actinoallomurus rhizosphaericola]
MPGRGARLFGRDRAVLVVREFMERPEQGRRRTARETPILIFEGPAGSGKTALLDCLEDALENRVPYARVDFAKIGNMAVYEVLAALAFELNRRCGDYGRLGFPRFIVGRAVMEDQAIDLTNRVRARAQVKALLEKYRNIAALRALIQRVAPPLQKILGIPQQIPVTSFADLLVDGLMASGRWGRQMLLGAGQDWYGDQDLGLGADSIDELVQLNARFRAYETDGNRGMVDGLLLAAFTADLREAFKKGRAAKRQFSAAVLLDNADLPDGQHFLVELARIREARAAGDSAVPLVFVATSRGLLTARVARKARPYAQPETAGCTDHLNRGPTARWWYPIVLRDLSESEVETMVAALGLHGAPDRRIAAMVYHFTGGHPGATRSLLDAIARQPEGPYDVRALLDRTDDHGGTLGERLLGDLLAHCTKRQADKLVIAAAARDQDESDRLITPRGLLRPADVASLYTPDLWGGGDPPEPAVLHPVLRRLMSRRLAGTEGQANWVTVHQRLRVAAEAEADEAGELYHALALGEIPIVTRRLAARLTALDGDAWLALLDAVVAAPRAASRTDDPADEAQLLAGWADAEADTTVQALAPLVTGLWVVTDPLTGAHRRDLHLDIAAGYDAITRFSPRRRQALRQRAQDHQQQALLWD